MEAVPDSLVPSQVPRRRKRAPKKKNSEEKQGEETKEDSKDDQKPKAKRKRNPRKKKATATPPETATKEVEPSMDTKSEPTKKKRNKKKKNKPPAAAWKSQLPDGAVDPITLESLRSLRYPPFALVATEPYTPIPEWPLTEDTKETTNDEDRQVQILQEQWGQHLTIRDEDNNVSMIPEPTLPRHLHLYDGRALAYWMVASNQFIDPLNRRDVTRDELLALDAYLRQHGVRDCRVTEAYDAKGITISTAGAVGHTAEGRAAIRQQQASQLLNALFGGVSVAQPRATLRSQYNEFRQDDEAARRVREQRPDWNEPHLLETPSNIIDDDEVPLSGTAPEFVPGSLWSASHIAARYGQAAPMHESEFPSLAAPVASGPAATTEAEPPKKVLPPVRTLSKIGKNVKKTNPEEQQRQWEAREAARRKAMMSNLTFGSNPASWDVAPAVLPATITTVTERAAPTEGQLERNRAFAEALGVQPATARYKNEGWARPSEGKSQLDDYGNELNAIEYPDALILKARERMPLLLKVEKKWKTFMVDDKAASLPLNPMDRPTRVFVHEYSDYWKLHTESFDPEPKRYIHCVKMQDTGAPFPLLSDVARSWKGPRTILLTEHSLEQSAGQSTKSREIPASNDRVPLALEPRSGVDASSVPPGLGIGGAPTRTQANDETTSRFGALAEGRDRPKLELQPRTLPLELPPFQAESRYNVSEDLERSKLRKEEKDRKEREEAAHRQRVLESAFASDDEAEDSSWGDEEEEEYDSVNEEEGEEDVESS